MRITSVQVLSLLLWVHCAVIGPGVSGLDCYGTLDLCQYYSINSWQVSRVERSYLDLSNCNYRRPQRNDQLFLYTRLGGSYNYGKFDIVTVYQVNSFTGSSTCRVYLTSSITNIHAGNRKRCLIAQKFPYLGDVNLHNGCVLTCSGASENMGGILALRAQNLNMEGNAKIDMSGKGLHGGEGGTNTGAGGRGANTRYCSELSGRGDLMCPASCTAGNGGDAGQPGSAGAGGEAPPKNEYFTRLIMGEGGGGGGATGTGIPGGRGGNGGGVVYLQVDGQLTMSTDSRILANGQQGFCYNSQSSGGGSGDGGSVILHATTGNSNLPWASMILVNNGGDIWCNGGGGGDKGQYGVKVAGVNYHSNP